MADDRLRKVSFTGSTGVGATLLEQAATEHRQRLDGTRRRRPVHRARRRRRRPGGRAGHRLQVPQRRAGLRRRQPDHPALGRSPTSSPRSSSSAPKAADGRQRVRRGRGRRPDHLRPAARHASSTSSSAPRRRAPTLLTGGCGRRRRRILLRAHRAPLHDRHHELCNEELFAPVATLYRVDSAAEAIAFANDTALRSGRLRVHQGPVAGGRGRASGWTSAWSASTAASWPTRRRPSAASRPPGWAAKADTTASTSSSSEVPRAHRQRGGRPVMTSAITVAGTAAHHQRPRPRAAAPAEDGAVRAGPAPAAPAAGARASAERALICTDARMAASASSSSSRDELAAAGVSSVSSTIRYRARPAARATSVDIVEQFGAASVDVVVGIGGGCCMDLAKVAVAGAHARRRCPRLLRRVPGPGPGLPVITVPTTGGTGAEVTCISVVFDEEQGMKVGVASPHLEPTAAIIDPELTSDLPARADRGDRAPTRCRISSSRSPAGRRTPRRRTSPTTSTSARTC